MLVMPLFLGYMYWNLPPYIEFSLFGSEILGNIAFILYVAILFFGYPWAGLLFTYFGIVPLFNGRPKSYDLLEDKVQVTFRTGKSFSIPFAEIEKFHFFGRRSARPLINKILDPFYRIPHNTPFTIKVWFTEVILNMLPPYSFGFSSRHGEIQIHRRKGVNKTRILLPWLNTFKRSKIISLSPSDPKEFFEQLEVAYAKWKKLHS